MKLITVATFNEISQAEPLKNRLAQAGVHAVVHDESNLEKLWFVSKPYAGVRLEVPPEEIEKARQMLEQWEPDGALRNAVRCPECASSRIEYPQFTRKFFTPNLVGLLSAMRVLEKEFYCQDCHYTWPPAGAKPSRLRPHRAPYYFIEGIEQNKLKAGASAGKSA